MSTKLVKKLLNSLIQENQAPQEVAKAQKAKAKKRAAKVAKKQKELQKEAQNLKAQKLIAKKNLRYFQETQKTSALTAELMNQLLNGGAKKTK